MENTEISTVAPHPGRISHRFFLIRDGMVLIGVIALVLTINRGMNGVFAAREHSIKRGMQPLVETVLYISILSTVVLGLRLRQPRPRLAAVFRQPGAVACATAVILQTLLGLTLLLAGLVQTALVRLDVVAKRMAESPWRMEEGPSLFKYSGAPGRDEYPVFHAQVFEARKDYTASGRVRKRFVPFLVPDYPALILLYGAAVGAAVTGAWILLAISGRRRPERSWLDRSGRLIGGFWILNFWLLVGAFMTSFF